MPKPDYEHMEEQRFRQQMERGKQSKKGEKKAFLKSSIRNETPVLRLDKQTHVLSAFPDDPYYCGLRARIPNFAKTKAQKEKDAARYAAAVAQQQSQQPPAATPSGGLPPGHPMMWHRGYLDNGKAKQPSFATSVNSLLAVPHHNAMPGYAGGFRNGRPFERNPTTWVPQAPLRNGGYFLQQPVLFSPSILCTPSSVVT